MTFTTPQKQELAALLLALGGGLNPFDLGDDDRRKLRSLKRWGLLMPSRFAADKGCGTRPAIIVYRLTDEGRTFLQTYLPG